MFKRQLTMFVGVTLHVVLFLLYVVAALLLLWLMGVGWIMQRLYAEHDIKYYEVGNCWSYVVPRWLIDPRHTYLIIRLSRSVSVPHVFFAKSIDGLNVEEFYPLNRLFGWKAWIDAIWYLGKVRKGVGEKT